MRSITIEVPDEVADRIETASKAERLVWVYRFADLVENDVEPRSLQEIFADITRWQAEHGVPTEEFDKFFAELCDED